MEFDMRVSTILWLAALATAVVVPPASGARADDSVSMNAEIHHLEQSWAHIKYQVSDADQQSTQMEALANEAAGVVERYPDRAEPMVWNGVITSTEAGLAGALSALHYAKAARTMFEQAEKMDPKALDGAAATSLGSLYYMVPGFPLGFGNKSKAREYLEQGLAISPDGLDSNFFYGDFLFQQRELVDARRVLRHALEAPASPDRPVWDAGRRDEVKALLAKIDQKLASSR
jgi:tetratricopeptide (TPR) repeat protein